MSVNKVILVGNVGKDPEARQLNSGTWVVNFSLATSEYYRDRDGNRQEITEWHNVEVWDNLAETVRKYVKKGSMLYVEGRIRTNKWEDKETGQPRSNKHIRANVVTFLNSVSSDSNSSSSSTSSAPENTSGTQNDTSDADDLPF